MPKATIVVPAYNVAATLQETLRSLLAQTYGDFEVVVVDDGSVDDTVAIARGLGDARIRIVSQDNRGLAGARNTGIAAARGDYIGFCDADDLWRPGKLAAHVAHLDGNSDIGISFSGATLIDEDSQPIGLSQRPRLRGITAAHMFRRNPIGNGSSPVIRRAALDDIAFRPMHEELRDWYFDERLRQSEDIELWLRLMLTTDWVVEGVSGALTSYRVAAQGLSAGITAQYGNWQRMVTKLAPLDPAFFARTLPAARAYQLRYLARRAVSAGQRDEALCLMQQAFAASFRPLWEEPVKTLSTLSAAAVLRLVGPKPVDVIRRRLRRRAANS
ncbi:glycosyltransferase [Pseudooceanicola sediminis]|uniref:Glycosyltransferase n=2 Tax=Pseudooceanicola sediminis TaxID=2211117 RepID=A0A399J484_9RHOB|nr:glycosyltransferase family 2 protein [Puniceibacterium sp. HSS470]RII40081.1 glycosyltransferase [Pseudooceanicola sediminis]